MDKLKLRRTKEERRGTKKIFWLLAGIFFYLSSSFITHPSSIVYAAVPHLINYQGRLTDASGIPLNGSYNLTFRIYDAETAGNLLWEETHSGVVIEKGIFGILLGSVTNLNLPFDKQYYLETKVGTEVMSPRQRITSAGYAIRAEEAETASSLNISAQQGDILYFNGTNWVELAPGTPGQFLKTQGPGANPTWANASFWVPTNIQVFTSSGTWIKPAGISTVYVKVWGGGGGGCGSETISNGGGGGGYSEGLVAVSGNVTVTVGAGGAGGLNPTAGGTSLFVGNITLTATGGASGDPSAGGIGGNAAGGTINIIGGRGTTGSTTYRGGKGGGSPMGGAGGGNLAEGTTPGGGGCYIGNGAPGLVIVYY